MRQSHGMLEGIQVRLHEAREKMGGGSRESATPVPAKIKVSQQTHKAFFLWPNQTLDET